MQSTLPLLHDIMACSQAIDGEYHTLTEEEFHSYNKDNWTYDEFVDFLNEHELSINNFVVIDGLTQNSIYYMDYDKGRYSKSYLELNKSFFLAPLESETIIKTLAGNTSCLISKDYKKYYSESVPFVFRIYDFQKRMREIPLQDATAIAGKLQKELLEKSSHAYSYSDFLDM